MNIIRQTLGLKVPKASHLLSLFGDRTHGLRFKQTVITGGKFTPSKLLNFTSTYNCIE